MSRKRIKNTMASPSAEPRWVHTEQSVTISISDPKVAAFLRREQEYWDARRKHDLETPMFEKT